MAKYKGKSNEFTFEHESFDITVIVTCISEDFVEGNDYHIEVRSIKDESDEPCSIGQLIDFLRNEQARIEIKAIEYMEEWLPDANEPLDFSYSDVD